jgi:hypothetical protein
MDPEGSPIGDPFGPPTLLARAPDSLAIYTTAGAETSSSFVQFVTDPGGGIHVIGIGSLDEFPNDAPDLRQIDYYAVMKGQTIIRLPDNEGPFNIPFSYMSALGEYVFQIDGSVEGQVSKFLHQHKRSLKLEPRHLSKATAHLFAPNVTIVAGDRVLIDAPFRGPGMIGTTEDGRFAALGCDERGIFWLKLWEERRWQPEGKRWEKIGTLDDVLAERKQPPRRQSAKRGKGRGGQRR